MMNMSDAQKSADTDAMIICLYILHIILEQHQHFGTASTKIILIIIHKKSFNDHIRVTLYASSLVFAQPLN